MGATGGGRREARRRSPSAAKKKLGMRVGLTGSEWGRSREMGGQVGLRIILHASIDPLQNFLAPACFDCFRTQTKAYIGALTRSNIFTCRMVLHASMGMRNIRKLAADADEATLLSTPPR
jgi:hypothetical protein